MPNPASLCAKCKAIPFKHLPSEEEDGIPHHASLNVLEKSSETCDLCYLLLWALGCSLTEGGGWCTLGSIKTSTTNQSLECQWTRSMYPMSGVRSMESGHTLIDFSGAKADLRPPIRTNPRSLVKDGTAVRPWLFGNWYSSAFLTDDPLLIGLGVRLGTSPRTEDAVGSRTDTGEIRIRFPGTFLRLRTEESEHPFWLQKPRTLTESRQAHGVYNSWSPAHCRPEFPNCHRESQGMG